MLNNSTYSRITLIILIICCNFQQFQFIVSSSKSSFSYHYQLRRFIDDGNRWLCLMIGLCTTFDLGHFQTPGLTIISQWSQLEFDYPSPNERQNDISNGRFLPGKIAPVDIDVYYANDVQSKVFITIPRFQDGVPATLGTVSEKIFNGNPVITPYPSWSWHRNLKQCNDKRIVSVFRVHIDECGRLWVLDTGKIQDETICPAQVLAFDLKTNELVHRYEIPSRQLEPRSLLVTLIVDVRDAHTKCHDTFIYMADCQSYSILVHDVEKSTSWRIIDKTMYPWPSYGTYHIDSDQFELMDGVLGMSLEPYQPGRDRRLFYHAMTSPTENWVYTSMIRNQSRFNDDPQSSPEIFHTYKGTRNGPSAAEAIDRDGIMYFGILEEITMNCWNINTEYGDKTLDTIARNRETLQFSSGVKVITNKKGVQELWILTSRLQKLLANTLNGDVTNFRILAGKTMDLLFNSKCRHRHNPGTHPAPNGGGYGLRPHPAHGK